MEIANYRAGFMRAYKDCAWDQETTLDYHTDSYVCGYNDGVKGWHGIITDEAYSSGLADDLKQFWGRSDFTFPNP